LFGDQDEKSMEVSGRLTTNESEQMKGTPSSRKFQTPCMAEVASFPVTPAQAVYEKILNGGAMSERLRRPVIYEFDVYVRV
jgi:hypothetical protein